MRYILSLIDSFAVQTDLNITDTLQPFILQPELDKIVRRLWWFPFSTRRMTPTHTCEDFDVAIVKVFVVAEEIVDDELFFTGMRRGTRSSTPHLLVQNWATDTPGHH